MVNCKQIQKMIVAFDKEQLPIKYEQMFVNHIKNCADCRDCLLYTSDAADE